MSVSSNSLLGSQAAGNKSNQLLAVLSTDNGVGNQFGQNFSQVLKDMSILPTPMPAPAPPPRVESSPSPAPAAAAAPKPEPASHTEQAPNATGDEGPSSQAPTPASSASKAAASNEAVSKVAKDDSALAGGKAVREGDAVEQTDTSNKKTSKSIKSLAGDAEDSTVPDLTPVTLALEQRRPVAQAAAPEADASTLLSLANLMPSVAQAVFRQDSRAQAAGAGAARSEAKSSVPTSTEERAKVLSAKAQDMAALMNADAAPVDLPLKDLPTMNPDVSRTLVGDKSQNSSAPSFSSVMQATQLAAGPFAAPVNASVSQAPVPSTAVHMKSDLHGPGFAPEMAARLTVLAGEGVQRAELHLNPAEMGPVSVNIVLDGQEAQVQFHAQHALTREVLERSLPELAAALRDAGLTLSGGGVFQQPHDAKPDDQAQRSNAAPGQSRNFGPDIGGSEPAPVTVRHTQVGVLDMYA